MTASDTIAADADAYNYLLAAAAAAIQEPKQ